MPDDPIQPTDLDDIPEEQPQPVISDIGYARIPLGILQWTTETRAKPGSSCRVERF